MFGISSSWVPINSLQEEIDNTSDFRRFPYIQMSIVFLFLIDVSLLSTATEIVYMENPQDLIRAMRKVVQSLSQPFSFLKLKSLSYLSSQESINSSRKTFAISKSHLKKLWDDLQQTFKTIDKLATKKNEIKGYGVKQRRDQVVNW